LGAQVADLRHLRRTENGTDLNKNLIKMIDKPSKKLERSSAVA